MSDASNPAAPARRPPWIVFAAIGLALVLAVWGVLSRVRAEADLKQATEEAAIPTVNVAKAQPGPPIEEVVLPGSVRAVLETPIYARTSGYVRSWKTDLGAPVKAGQLLAEIDTPEVDEQLRQAQADLKTAQANADVAQSNSKRAQILLAQDSLSRQEAEDRAATALSTAAQVESSRANLARLSRLSSFQKVSAPYAGVITARETDVGALINAGSGQGQELFRIADTRRLRIYVQVPQSYAAQIKVGGMADLQFSEHPGRAFPAAVARTAQALDPQSRTLQVELEVDNAKGELFPGSFTQVHFKLPAGTSGLRLSGNTLLFRAEGLRVAVVGPDERVSLRSIVQGRDFGTSVEVLQGVGPQDRVILNPPAAIQNGDKVRIATAKP